MTASLIYCSKSILFIFIGLFGIGLLISFHELGHFIFAKIFGVRTPSFSIGMGPVVASKKIGGTEFKLSAIPLGGYVEIAGLAEIGQGEQRDADAMDSGSFQAKPYWQKILIMSGGVLFNMLLALIIFFGLFATGMPKTLLSYPEEIQPVIARIQPNSVAAATGLQSNDTIIAINAEHVTNVLDVISLIHQHNNKSVTITILRDAQTLTLNAQLDDSGRLGIEYHVAYMPAHTLRTSLQKAWHMTTDVTNKTYRAFTYLFKKRTTDGVAGPLFIISQMVQNAKQGAAIFLLLLAFISINLAIINLIPLPITDGGQIIFITIEALTKRNIPESVRLIAHNISWLLILALLIYLTAKDSIVLFWPTIKNMFMHK
jgi:regulator of sigma E protease